MRVYLNRAAQPSLVVPRLQGLRPDGGLASKGPAIYANLIIDPGAAADLSAVPAASVERGTIMAWRAAPPSVYNRNGAVTARDAPTGDAWSTIEVEPTGLVNLGRVLGLARAPSPSLAWLRTEVTASGPLRRTLQVGFADEVWVFLNGQLVTSGKNQYYPYASRLSPDGRLEPNNLSISMNLRRGRNEILLRLVTIGAPVAARLNLHTTGGLPKLASIKSRGWTCTDRSRRETALRRMKHGASRR